MKQLIIFILCICIFNTIYGQDKLTSNTYKSEANVKVPAKLSDIAWLVGHWQGEGFGGVVREIWSPANAGQMVATFSMMENENVIFHEFCMIAEENGTIIYKVKHFNRDLTSWEEKNEYVTFPLVKIEPHAVYFNGFTMIHKGDHIDLFLALKQDDGSHIEEKLVYYPFKSNYPAIHIPDDVFSKKLRSEIDRDVWFPFIKAYANNDQKLYMSLHSKDLIRGNGGRGGSISDFNTYEKKSADHFNNVIKKQNKIEIAFAFIERYSNENTASERGIYRYTQIMGETKNHYYGKFHVLLRKIKGKWKIIADYDSDEDGSINEEDFKRARSL